MSKSTPIQALQASQASQSIQGSIPSKQIQIEEPVDDNVREVLENINAETYSAPVPPFQNYIQPGGRMFDDVDDTDDTGKNTSNNGSMSIGGFQITNDMKLALISALIFIAVYQIPIEKIVFTYISLDKLPFSEVVIKGLIAGVIFLLLARVVSTWTRAHRGHPRRHPTWMMREPWAF